MADYSFNMKMSGSINLDNFSAEAIERIRAFIEQVKAEENGVRAEVPASKVRKTRAAAEEVTAEDPGEKTSEDKWEKVGQYKGYEKIVDIFKDAEEHPENYRWEYQLSSAWSTLPELKGVSVHTVAHVLGSMAKHGITQKTVKKREKDSLPQNWYLVPIKNRPMVVLDKVNTETDEDPEVNPRDKRLGEMLRKARTDRDLSLKDVADGVGVVVTLIMNYEAGRYTMTELMRKQLCGFFHEDIFEGAEESA